jgi:hypothetical protein
MLTVEAIFYVNNGEESLTRTLDPYEYEIQTYGDLLEYLFVEVWVSEGPMKRCYDICQEFYVEEHEFDEKISEDIQFCRAIFTIERH